MLDGGKLKVQVGLRDVYCGVVVAKKCQNEPVVLNLPAEATALRRWQSDVAGTLHGLRDVSKRLTRWRGLASYDQLAACRGRARADPPVGAWNSGSSGRGDRQRGRREPRQMPEVCTSECTSAAGSGSNFGRADHS